MRRFCLLAVLAAAGSIGLFAQCTTAPCISSLQSDFPGAISPAHGAAVTAATLAPDGINVYINGMFVLSDLVQITWTGTSAPPPGQKLNFISVNATQVVANVPSALFASAGTASITVNEAVAVGAAPSTSNPATFTVNPALSPTSLTTGLVGIAYSQPLATGGTANYSISLGSGTLPPGFGSYIPGPAIQNDLNLPVRPPPPEPLGSP
jgi:hypothetical protein